MIVQVLSLGTAFWRTSSAEPADGRPSSFRTAYLNTSGFKTGRKTTYSHWKKGFVRFNGTTLADVRLQSDLLQMSFETGGVEEYRGSNRILLRRRAAKESNADAYLVTLKSAMEGAIDFSTQWRSPKVRIVSASFRKGEQETILLIPHDGFVITTLGRWEIQCCNRKMILMLS